MIISQIFDLSFTYKPHPRTNPAQEINFFELKENDS